VLCFWIGLYPKPFFAMLEPASQRLTAVMEQARPADYRWEGEAVRVAVEEPVPVPAAGHEEPAAPAAGH
jgi:hypothetical protein